MTSLLLGSERVPPPQHGPAASTLKELQPKTASEHKVTHYERTIGLEGIAILPPVMAAEREHLTVGEENGGSRCCRAAITEAALSWWEML
jgi:hypothetical protein